MKVSIYLAHETDGSLKDREREFGEALKFGFERHGETVEMLPSHEFVEPDWQSNLAVIIGIKGHSRRISHEYKRGGRQVMLVDKAYFGRTRNVRLSLNGFQPPYAHSYQRPADRWERVKSHHRIRVRPKRTDGAHIIFAGSSQKYCDWHGLGDVSDYAERMCLRIDKLSRPDVDSPKRKILYRPKPSWAAGHPQEVRLIPDTQFSSPYVNILDELKRCQVLVTHGSNAAVDAIIAGVPVIVQSKGACAAEPVAGDCLKKLHDPYFPDDAERLQWLANLAYCQFNINEIREGYAWEIIAPRSMKAALEEIKDLPPGENEIAQYRLMHTELGDKVFRGNSVRAHVAAIARCVRKHEAATLLDYGSGKGRQYEELAIQAQWGGIKPTCYDPGYPPISQKPEGRFDGVICTDVAEHIPESEIDSFLRDVVGYARKFVFFSIFTEPARKFLPDGRNCHLITMPRAWWLDRIQTATGGVLGKAFMVDGDKHNVIQVPDGPEIAVIFGGSD